MYTKFSHQDIIAAIGFEARRIANAVDQHAAGAAFPDPASIRRVIERMAELNGLLIQGLDAIAQAEQDAIGLFPN